MWAFKLGQTWDKVRCCESHCAVNNPVHLEHAKHTYMTAWEYVVIRAYTQNNQNANWTCRK